MRIRSVRIVDFASFDEFELNRLDPSLNVLVGPNGSGKTNLSRAITMARDILDRNKYKKRSLWAKAHRLGASSDAFRVEIQFDIVEEIEKQTLTSFFKAVLATAPVSILVAPGKSSVDQEVIERFHLWLDRELTTDKFESLFSGVLAIEHTRHPTNEWDISFCFEHDDQQYEWVMESRHRQQGLFNKDSFNSQVRARQTVMFLQRYLREDSHESFSQPYALNHMLPSSNDGVNGLEVEYRSGSPYPKPILEFGQLMGVDIANSNQRYDLMEVLANIVNSAVLISEDIRVPPTLDYSAEDLERPLKSHELHNGAKVPLYLFKLKNGPSHDRKVYAQICELFEALTDTRLDVVASARTSDSGEEASLAFRIEPVVIHVAGEVPVELAGAGAWESLILSVFLCYPRKTFIILDEPALNLHPSLQRKLLSLSKAAQAQLLIVTHSPYLVPVEDKQDLARIIRFFLEDGNTRMARLISNEGYHLMEGRLARVLKELTGTADFVSLLFARGTVLVEGETELGALQTWFYKSQTAKQRGTLEDFNLAIVSVGGDKNFKPFVDFATIFRIPWVIICDGKVLKGGKIFSLLEMNHLHVAGGRNFEEERELAEQHGVFTLASKPDDEFEDLPEVQEQTSEAKKRYGGSKVRQGRYIAQEKGCPPLVDSLYCKLLNHLELP